MAETNASGGGTTAPATATSADNNRIFALVVYGLFLAAFCNGLTALVGVVLAYIKRSEARGTPYESHFTNAIEVFWISLVVALVALPLVFLFGLGLLVYLGLIVWYLYRTIKGLVHAIDAKPY